MVNTSFLIKPGVAKYLSGPTMVYAGKNVNLSWYVDTVKYDSADTSSLIYSSYEGGDWIQVGEKLGTGLKGFSQPLIKLGNWDFKVVIWTLVKFGFITILLPVETEVIENIQCVFPKNIKVDVQIMYDDAAMNEMFTKWGLISRFLPLYVDSILDDSYQNYWEEDIDFFAYKLPQWFIHDPYQYYFDNWDNYNDLPDNQGNGEKFDIGILFTSDVNRPYAGIKWPNSNKVIINVYYIELLDWNNNFEEGLFSVIMHEVGHCFGITGEGNVGGNDQKGLLDSTGDTARRDKSGNIIGGIRRSVMDYYYGLRSYNDKFDQGHKNTIASNIARCVS